MPASISPVLCPKSNEPVVDKGSYFFFKGYPGIYFYKEMYHRKMTVDDYLAVIRGESPKFKGFVSQKNKPFAAKLVLKEVERKVALHFENGPGMPLDVICPLSKEPVQDCGEFFIFPGYPDSRFYKLAAKRQMTAEEYSAALKADAPIFLDGFVSKKGDAFSAAFKFSDETKRMDFVFAPRAPSSRPSGGRSGIPRRPAAPRETEAAGSVSEDFGGY